MAELGGHPRMPFSEDEKIAYAKELYVTDVIDLDTFEFAVDDILAGDGWEILFPDLPMGGLPPSVR